MEFNNLPGFEIELPIPENGQEKGQEQENVEGNLSIDNGDGDNGSEIDIDNNEGNDVVEYGDNSDELAIQTYNQLLSKGVIIEDENLPFDGTWENLEEQLTSLPQRVLNTIVQEAPEITKQILKFTFSSENLSKEDIREFMKTYLDEMDSAETSDIETMDDAREYLNKVYSDRGMRPNAVRAALDALEEDDALLEEANEELKKGKESVNAKTNALIEQKQKEDSERIEAQQKFVQKIQEELDTIGWSESQVNRIRTILATNKLNELLNNAFKNPKALIKLTDFVSHFDIKTGDIDDSKYTKRVETKAALQFRDRVQHSINTPNSNTKTTLTNPNKDLQDLTPVFN